MSFQRPTLVALADRIQTDFVTKLELLGAVLRRAVVRVLSAVIAGAAHMMHGHLDFLARQLFPDLSEDDFLVRQAGLFGLTKNAPGFAKGTIPVENVNAFSTFVPAGSLLTSSGGFEYASDTDLTVLAFNTGNVGVTAVLAGSESTLDVDVELSFESPIAGVPSTVSVVSVEMDGSDQETTEALRVRLLERMADPPHGGTEADYEAWAKEITGVTRVWVESFGLGPGTVVVRFVRDGDGAGAAVIPSAGEVTTVQTKLDVEKPAHATVTAIAPIDSALAMTIHIDPDTTPLRDAVMAEIDAMFLRTAEPAGTTLRSSILTALGRTVGLDDYALTVPAGDTAHTAGQLPRRGTVTWT